MVNGYVGILELSKNYPDKIALARFKLERKKDMDFKLITSSDILWSDVRDYAKNCSWRAGKSLADAMDNNLFEEWERVVFVLDNHKICGYCTVAKTDCIPGLHYTPYIGYLFVGEEYRGNRLGEKMIQYSMDYLKSVGFDRVYLVSDHENLYEKYGFKVIDKKPAPWGAVEKIYMKRIV